MGADMDLDDLGGALGGTVGGLTAWLRDNRPGWRSLLRLSLSGLVCGVTSFFVTKWRFPDVPWGVNVGASALVGIAASPIIELFLLLVNKLSIVAQRVTDGWLAYAERRHGPPAQPAGPVAPPSVAPAVVVVGGVPAGAVRGEFRGEQLPAAAPNGTTPRAERPDEKAG